MSAPLSNWDSFSASLLALSVKGSSLHVEDLPDLNRSLSGEGSGEGVVGRVIARFWWYIEICDSCDFSIPS